MAEIVNLRIARKAKQREDQAREADASRAKHGRTKAERDLTRAEAERAARLFEGARREDDGGNGC